jgi:hypothetical protein
MDRQSIDKVCEQIYRRFPDVAGVRPKVSSYTDDQSLLIFQTKAKTANGHSITRTVRVVATADGKVKKATTSR